jgi:hypothetical protein
MLGALSPKILSKKKKKEILLKKIIEKYINNKSIIYESIHKNILENK